MKMPKMIDDLRDALDMNKKKRKKEALQNILKKMKKKELSLKKSLSSASGKEKKRLQDSIKVSKAHRKKGIKALRKLKGKG